MLYTPKNLTARFVRRTYQANQMEGQYLTIENVLKNSLKSESTAAEQPSHIKVPLKLHQRTLLNAARKLETNRPNGISFEDGTKMYTKYGVIADRVGSGKSLVALSLAGFERPQTESYIVESTPHNSLVIIRPTKDDDKLYKVKFKYVKASLLVVPHTLICQWERYIEDQTTLKSFIVKNRKILKDPKLIDKIKESDIVVVSSTMWKDFDAAEEVSSIYWSRLFMDEADTIVVSITNESQVRAAFYWFISASWLNILFPNYTHLWKDSICQHHPNTKEFFKGSTYLIRIDGVHRNNIVAKMCVGNTSTQDLRSNYAYRLILRNDETFIQESLKMPNINHHRWICAIPASVRILHNMISPAIMEMLHAGDSDSALQALNIQQENVTNVVEGVTRHLQQQIESAVKYREYRLSLQFPNAKAKQEVQEACDKKIAELQEKLKDLKSRIEKFDDTECPICYDSLTNATLTPCCKNLFCFTCIADAFTRNPICPLCRAKIASLQELRVLKDDTTVVAKVEPVEKENEEKPKTKAQRLLDFLDENKTAKVLLFSSYDRTFEKLTHTFNQKNINYSTVSGSSQRVSKILREFNEGKFQILCLNARHLGAGLNIDCATHVILYHRMGEEMEKQIVGRAHRLGRNAELDVIHLLHENELESNNTYNWNSENGNVILDI